MEFIIGNYYWKYLMDLMEFIKGKINQLLYRHPYQLASKIILKIPIKKNFRVRFYIIASAIIFNVPLK